MNVPATSATRPGDRGREPRNRVLVCYLCFGLLVFVAAVAGADTNGEVELPTPNQRWIEVHSANFVFFSNAGGLATKRVAVDLEELRAVLAELGEFTPNSPVPTYIYVFRNDRSFTPYKRLLEGDPTTIGGFFLGLSHANFIAINADSPDASGTVFHEFVHYVTSTNMWWVPVWLSEGLAEFYQTFEVVGGTAYIGLPIRSHLNRIGGRTLVPFSELLTVDHTSPLYNERYRKGDFYAQSWALTHYLLLGNEERRQQLSRYLFLMRNGSPEMEAFSIAFGTDYKTLQNEVLQHFRGPRLPIIQEKTETDVDQRLEIREMAYPDVLYRLGDLLSNERPEKLEAARFFEAALEIDPTHGPSLMAIALQAEERADWVTARGAYERALRARPNDPRTLFRWGEFQRRRGSDLKDALAALKKSTELDPSFAPAWVALSSVYAELGVDSSAALTAAQKAHRLMPTDKNVTQDLLTLYLKLDDREHAVELIEDTLRSNRIIQAQAWTTVLMKDLQRAREDLMGNRLEAAKKRVELAGIDVERTSQPESIQRNIASMRKTIAEHEGARLYDQAVILIDEGRPDEARALLTTALSNLDESAVARSCRHLIDVLDHPEEYEADDQSPFALSPTRDEIANLNQLLAARDLESAHSFLMKLRINSAGAQQRWIDDKIGEIERTQRYNHYVDGYNKAVDLYNRGDFTGAIEVLEELLEILPAGYQADSARALAADARAALTDG